MDGDIIYTYTARDAERDGILRNVSKPAREAGIRVPTRISLGVHELCTPNIADRHAGQSYRGRLWDVLNMARWAALTNRDDYMAEFEVIVGHAAPGGTWRQDTHTLWLFLEDDGAGPGFVICKPEER